MNNRNTELISLLSYQGDTNGILPSITQLTESSYDSFPTNILPNKFEDVLPCFSVIPEAKVKITPSFLSKLKAQNPETKNELLLAIEQAVDEGYIATKENKMGEFNERLVSLCFTERFKVQNLPPGERCGLDGFFIFEVNSVKHAVIYDAKTSKVWGNSSSRAATNWKLIKGTDQAVLLGVERANVLALVICLGLYEPTSVKHNNQGFTEIAGNAAWELCTGDPFFLPWLRMQFDMNASMHLQMQTVGTLVKAIYKKLKAEKFVYEINDEDIRFNYFYAV